MEGLREVPQWQTQRSAHQQTLLDTQRNRTAIALLAQVCDIQPKDVPILVYAYEFYTHEPSVLTNDAAFAAFTPAGYNLPAISLQYVE